MTPNPTSSLEWTTDASRIDFDSLIGLFDAAIGGGIAEDFEYFRPDPDYVSKNFNGCAYGLFVLHEGRLIACGRAFSDDHMCAWLSGVCVHPDWRGKGIGRKLVERINKRFTHIPLYADALKLEVDFYQKCGIRAKPKLVSCAAASRDVPDIPPLPKGVLLVEGAPGCGWSDVSRLFNEVGFESLPETVEKCFGAGIYGTFALAEGRLVGLVRVMSDDILTSWVAEVCVHPDWQRRGIGTALLTAARRRFAHSASFQPRPSRKALAAEWRDLQGRDIPYFWVRAGEKAIRHRTGIVQRLARPQTLKADAINTILAMSHDDLAPQLAVLNAFFDREPVASQMKGHAA